ncbi:auxilin-like clathrin-binding protein required for normal clathrin function [Yamadazyma tenuis]|uniref:auxilin-like clathrin-binding protein required for normal clathrin function n=1 Tax=Candida tenuis TaxID=2315449 RepID=UPI0027A0F0C0|nr:auxilin-like clathrin-binding protein required for normal clathrin function [Yamadazyma tenuis]
MAPPKKDVFADLFPAGNTTTANRRKNLADLQKDRYGNNSNAGNMGMDIFDSLNSSKASFPVESSTNTWDEIGTSTSGSRGDSSSSVGNSSQTGSNVHTPLNSQIEDPFDIFKEPSVASNSTSNKASTINSVKPTKPTNNPQNNAHSLLDDEFTDAFQEEPQPAPISKSVPEKESFEPYSEDLRSNSSSSLSKRDELIAQLVDIGFPVEVSDSAISEVGMDLQACVNYIMNGGNSRSSSSSQPSLPRTRTHSPNKEDLGAKLNDLSTDFFNKASIFLNKSKETVIKNIEQFQQAQTTGRGSPSNSLPVWMQDSEKEKYKKREAEFFGKSDNDYSADEANIDHEFISNFMEEQKQKQKARNKARVDNLKAMAKNKIYGASPTKSPSPEKAELPPRPLSNPSRERVPATTKADAPRKEQAHQLTSKTQQTKAPQPDVDLLGVGGSLSRAEKFRNDSNGDEVYVSSRRRKPAAPTPSKPKASRKTTREPLDQFSQSDYDIGKEKATKSFANGDYDDALINYEKCLNVLTPTHELRLVINSNLALTLIKLGSYKQARDQCDQALHLINIEDINDESYVINDKPVKYWYIKLLSRKAEALEMIEAFSDSLECYMELVTKLGVNDKKVMDARRRVNNIVNPPPKPKPSVSRPKPSRIQPVNNDNLKRVQAQNKKQEDRDSLKYQLHDQVESKTSAWSNGKEDNLRSLLMSLPEILPASLGFPFLTSKKITINDLMLPKKVKINYMKVISSIHPDKLTSLNLGVEEEMLCQSIFITLNKSWDIFKEQNGIN